MPPRDPNGRGAPHPPCDLDWDVVTIEERNQLLIDACAPTRNERVQRRIGRDPGRSGQQLLSPHQARLRTEIDDMLEEAAKEPKPTTLA